MKKREKNAVFSKFKRTMVVSGAAAAILASSIVPAYAVEMDTNKSNEPAQENVQGAEAKQISMDSKPTGDGPATKEVTMDFTENMFSNTDAERRAALEKQYKIQLDFSDVWEDKKGQTTVGPDGVKREYTSHDQMKAMGFYAVNANRQELIQYAIRTGDWEPYNQYERDLVAKQEADKAEKVEKVAGSEKSAVVEDVTNVEKQTMKVASTTPIAAPTEEGMDFTSVDDKSNDEAVETNTDAVSKGESVPMEELVPSEENVPMKDLVPAEKVNPIEKLEPSEPVVAPTPPKDEELVGVNSNDDQERRTALEDKFGITLDPDDKWEDKKGQIAVNPDGTSSEYTSHDEMKALGFYAVNANRQELIQYGIRTDDWQPYRAFSALSEPAYFELVDDKFEYSKIYYGNDFENTRMSYLEDLAEVKMANDTDKAKQIESEMKKALSAIVENYKAAPGPNVYVVGLNSHDAYVAEWGVSEVDSGYFDSELNHPDVMDKGVYEDGRNPFTKLFQ